jgi:hypothetical protein
MAAKIKTANRKVRKGFRKGRKGGPELRLHAGGETAAFQQHHITPLTVHASQP